jgi:hypothetical protein
MTRVKNIFGTMKIVFYNIGFIFISPQSTIYVFPSLKIADTSNTSTCILQKTYPFFLNFQVFSTFIVHTGVQVQEGTPGLHQIFF